jgi:hypothetical protein
MTFSFLTRGISHLWAPRPARQAPAAVPAPQNPARAADPPAAVASRTAGATQGEEVARARVLSGATAVQPATIASPLNEAQRHFKQHPELAWLADAGVSATNEGLVSLNDAMKDSYSKDLGQKQFFPELERSLQSLRCLSLIVDGSTASHQEFVGHQFAPKISFAHFQTLSAQWKQLRKSYPALNEGELLQAAQAALVLGDMGKSPKAREEMRELGITDPDHDDFYGHVMRTPEALLKLPSFQALNVAQQKVVRDSAGLAHFGHITHCEGGPAMYANLTRTVAGKWVAVPFDFAMMVHTCDVAGALAHKSNQGSLTYNDHTHIAMQDTIASCQALASGDAHHAYHQYLSARAQRLGLSPDAPKDQMLARLGAMMRLFTPVDGSALWHGFSQLNTAQQAQAMESLMPEGAALLPRTPTYMPAVLVNLRNNKALGASPQERLVQAVQIGVPCITAALQTYRAMVSSGEMAADVPLNFNPIAAVAAGVDGNNEPCDPHDLQTKPLQINPDNGAVTLSH